MEPIDLETLHTVLTTVLRGSFMIYDNLGVPIDGKKAEARFERRYNRKPESAVDYSWAYLRYAIKWIEERMKEDAKNAS